MMDFLQTNVIKDTEWLQTLGTISKELSPIDNIISKNNFEYRRLICYVNVYFRF